MSKIVDLEEQRMLQHMRPLARILYRLVGACRKLVYKRPFDPDLDEVKKHLRDFDKEMNDVDRT